MADTDAPPEPPKETPAWVKQQKRTFTAWVNSKLAERKMSLPDDVDKSFHDGLHLIALTEVLTKAPIAKYDKKPKMRIQFVSNCSCAIQVLVKHSKKLDISAENFVDQNEKLILGFIWQLFITFVQQEGGAVDDLLEWVQGRVNGNSRYPGVNVTNFSGSWKDGEAISALMDSFNPSFVDFSKIDHANAHGNWVKSLDTAEEYLDVPKLLDADDMVGDDIDEKSTRMYLTLLRKAYESKQANLADLIPKRPELTHDEMVERMFDGIMKMRALKACPECQADLTAWLAEMNAIIARAPA
jgi:actinin alpha